MIPKSPAAVPAFLYGTAWKEERTEELVQLALDAGFRGIDTANQRKHYFEAAVGAALGRALRDGRATRDALFLQTKFTFARGQDHRLPYDPNADYATQVEQSFASSLEHLGTDYLDSYVLHGPYGGGALQKQDWDVWRAMERIAERGQVRFLGVSNVDLAQLRALVKDAALRPAFVQNRCYARTGWDRDVRAFCTEHGIVYQGFSLLTANARELERREVRAIAERAGATVPAVVFRFALALGMLPLTGTSNPAHMRADLASPALGLTPDEIRLLETISGYTADHSDGS
jgi:diketogulonate reductase-like aldo/keto reductase